YAEAQVRELIDRYSPSVLWNDITWPTDRDRLFKLFADYYRAVPDGVVNDRWMPWSPVLGAFQFAPARRLLNTMSTRTARSNGGMVPPKTPHFDVRTPEYVTFDDIQSFAWETVRGIDRSFGFNSNSLPSDLLQRDELTDMLAEIVSKGGNLLLNVGPRGVDATIPDAQLERLEWLGEWTSGDGSSIFESRPWIMSNAKSPEGVQLNYWARGEHVWVALRFASDASTLPSSVTVPGLRSGPLTEVSDASGACLDFSESPGGIRVDLGGAGSIDTGAGDAAGGADGGDPIVLRFDNVTAA
ncbi:MAG TPA: alpha-L-fucosidase, partial [Microthrixaceae bacterium]|nr:alpha-L-fucosidase [Microthrixaceae bacterium]